MPDSLEEETETSDEPWRDDEHATFGESLEDEALGDGDGYSESDDERFDAEEKERHPLLQRAMDLVVRFGTVFGDEDNVRAPAAWARSIKAAVTRWAGWRRRCPFVTTVSRISAFASCSSSRTFAALRLPKGAVSASIDHQ